MRSRYSAFARCLPDYLLATHDAPATPEERRAVEAAASSVTWLGLTVHRTEGGGPSDDHGVVEFTARSEDGRFRYALRERSRFRRVEGRWRYVDGESRMKRTPAG